jgi:hypothetical protein
MTMWHATEPGFPAFGALTAQPLPPPIPPDPAATPSKEEAFRAEVEAFASAMQAYKERSGRMFPTWCETLEVLRSLGYEKTGPRPGRPAPPRSRADPTDP